MPSHKELPQYAKIKLDVIAKIKGGVWEEGSQIPPETELESLYNTSRITVRRAMEELEKDGYIRRIQGKGTFVASAEPSLVKPEKEIKSFTQQLADARMEATTRIIEAGVCRAGEAQGRVLEGFESEIGEDGEVIRIQRLKSGNGKPFALQTVYLLPRKCPEILNFPVEDLQHLFKLYKTTYGREITTAREALRVASASAEEAELLQIETGAPVVLRDRISLDQYNESFEVLHSVDRVDRFVYEYVIAVDLTKVPPGS
jgi:GntR family transcriptional regulator